METPRILPPLVQTKSMTAREFRRCLARWALSYEDPLSFDRRVKDEIEKQAQLTTMGQSLGPSDLCPYPQHESEKEGGGSLTTVHIPEHPMVQLSTIRWELIESQGQSLLRRHCQEEDDLCWLPSAVARSTLPMRTLRVPGQQEGSGGKSQSKGSTIKEFLTKRISSATIHMSLSYARDVQHRVQH